MNYNYGTYPTMITPYNTDGSVDIETVKKYVHWYHKQGCDGIFAICQSSEIAWLSVEERVKINKAVYETVKEIEALGGRRMTVVSSGHVADSIEEQAQELNAVWESGTDALILITNRLDLNNEGDEVWIKNAKALLKKLPKDAALGLYECPAPYKRLVTDKILKWCIDTGRFYFMKDTCCDAAILKQRLSLKGDGAVYCGIMANYHPQLYAWLCKNFEKEPQKAELLSDFLSVSCFTENGLSYPLSAKYHMCLEGIKTELITRKEGAPVFNKYGEDCVKQLKNLADYFEKLILED